MEDERTEKYSNSLLAYLRRIGIFALMLLAVLALISYSPADAAVITGGADRPFRNWIGPSGGCMAYVLLMFTGLTAYPLILLLFFQTLRNLFRPAGRNAAATLSGYALLTFGLIILLGSAPHYFAPLAAAAGLGRADRAGLVLSGGVLGQMLSLPPQPEILPRGGLFPALIGSVGTVICGWGLLLTGIAVIYTFSWHDFMKARFFAGNDDRIPSGKPISLRERLLRGFSRGEEESGKKTDSAYVDADEPSRSAEHRQEQTDLLAGLEDAMTLSARTSAPEVVDSFSGGPAARPCAPVASVPEPGRKITVSGVKTSPVKNEKAYELPSVNMLSKGEDVLGENKETITETINSLQHTLDSFKIPGTVTGYVTGPRLTRYEISLEDGYDVKKLVGFDRTIAMNLRAVSVRILAPIPGRDVAGVEIPNKRSASVFLRSVMESDEWVKSRAKIPVVLGRDVVGNPLILDLTKAPHLLIAGTTGSGKSVCMNTLMMSLMFRFSPDDLRLIMVDPKFVEFADYAKLPHLITPLMNEAEKVPVALHWATVEMDNRYRIFAEAGVKQLSEYNSRPEDAPGICDEDGNEYPRRIPYLLVIIDELADLMSIPESRRDSENYISRIAAKGRAAGIHLVIATQRPDTRTITGTLKNNLPTRVAFKVGQMQDSRVILDCNGAEALLGQGDMLFNGPGAMALERAQGAFTPDGDIKAVAAFCSSQREQEFNDQVLAEKKETEENEDDDGEIFSGEPVFAGDIDIDPVVKKYLQPGDDDIVRQALEIILLERKASTSYLQRRLVIGYNKAASLIDLFEKRGIVGPPSGSGKKREIMIFDDIVENE